jgi:hypothetical protein
MKRLVFIALATAAALTGSVARAQVHFDDIQLSVPVTDGPIVTAGGDWTGTYAGRVFEGIFDAGGQAGSPGFDSPGGTFDPAATIRFDFAKQLLYWNGSALATPSATMTLDYQETRFATITGTELAGGPGFVITSVPGTGAFHDHLDYTVSAGAAAGLYGLVLTLGPGGSGMGFTQSEPFLVTFLQGNLDLPEYQAGMEALVDVAFAPVPEPSTVGLLGIAAVAGGWLASRRAWKKGSGIGAHRDR